MDHGLLAVDILAGVHGVDGGLLVPVVGGGDEDGVDVLAGEDLAVVAGGEEVVAVDLFHVGEAAVVAVGDGDELDAGDLHGPAGVALALDAGTDESEVDVVVGGGSISHVGEGIGEDRELAGEGLRRGHARGLKEHPAIETRHALLSLFRLRLECVGTIPRAR